MLASILSILLLYTAAAVPTYVPQSITCPTTSLIRDATGLSDEEEMYRVSRKEVADQALKTWLAKTNSGFDTNELPTIALTTSGGGLRSLLVGAGVIQGLDARDSFESVSGLYQALTYQAGLSGGSWLLSSLAGNNYPTISYLKKNLWEKAFADGLLDPSALLLLGSYAEIVNDILRKNAAGYHTTLTDPWGRLLSYQLLSGSDGGADITLSSVAGLSNFSTHAVPMPIITSLGTKVWQGDCAPGPNATTYEFTPFEFGSWDHDVSAFTPTKFLGTAMRGGSPAGSSCTSNYDSLGFILGTSSNLFNNACINDPLQNPFSAMSTILDRIVALAHEVATEDLYAIYANPFYEYISSTATPNVANNVSAQENLYLVDGGEALQNNPIFPLLQPARNVSVIIVNDNSADSNNFPNGSEILTTYVQSLNAGLTRMPFIPSVETFISQGLNKKATFFGCNDTSKVTLIYLPNNNYTFASNTPTLQFEYSQSETDGMVANGVEVVIQGGRAGWATCLACGLMINMNGVLPYECTACFEEYCYYE